MNALKPYKSFNFYGLSSDVTVKFTVMAKLLRMTQAELFADMVESCWEAFGDMPLPKGVSEEKVKGIMSERLHRIAEDSPKSKRTSASK